MSDTVGRNTMFFLMKNPAILYAFQLWFVCKKNEGHVQMQCLPDTGKKNLLLDRTVILSHFTKPGIMFTHCQISMIKLFVICSF